MKFMCLQNNMPGDFPLFFFPKFVIGLCLISYFLFFFLSFFSFGTCHCTESDIKIAAGISKFIKRKKGNSSGKKKKKKAQTHREFI